MKLRIEKDIKLNDYYVKFDIIDITNSEEELLSDFGKIKIEIGKDIPLDQNTTFRLGSEEKVLPDGFPFTKIFKNVTYGDEAEVHANAYVEEIKKRVQLAVDTLNAKVDDFSTVEEIQL